jgi:hypothetical protein
LNVCLCDADSRLRFCGPARYRKGQLPDGVAGGVPRASERSVRARTAAHPTRARAP